MSNELQHQMELQYRFHITVRSQILGDLVLDLAILVVEQ
jgi:hypothetical protein